MPVENVLFASEMVGAVRGVDPRTGHHFDDTRRYVEKAGLTPRTWRPSRRATPGGSTPASTPG